MQDRGVAAHGSQDAGSDFGRYLRVARESSGMDLDEVSQRTRVRLHWLQLIEGCRLDELPAEVFVRGFVRAYARTVGADESVASRMLSDRIAELSPPEESQPLMDALRDMDAGGRRRMGMALAVIVLLIAATLMVSMMWRRPAPAAGPISVDSPASQADQTRRLRSPASPASIDTVAPSDLRAESHRARLS